MALIRKLEAIDEKSLKRLIRGYVSQEKYAIRREENGETILFRLELLALEQPYQKQFELDALEAYQSMISDGFSLAAYAEDAIVGVALATVQDWNRALWIHEFHVLESHQGKGIGRDLMEALAEKARDAGLRIMFCETQNTNVPAIRFYRKLGFSLDALDLSLYSNEDYPDGEIALFMKRKV